MVSLGKVGVIFDGGGFNGIYQVGAAKAIWQRGITPVYVQGVSVGSLNAATIIEHGSVDPLEHIWFEVEKQGSSFLFPFWEALSRLAHIFHSPSLFSGKGLWKLVESIDVTKILNSQICFDVMTRNVSQNNKHTAFSNRDLRFQKIPELFRKALIASASIYGFFPAVEIDNEHHLDGLHYTLEPAIVFGCDTIFILTVDHVVDRHNVEWSRMVQQPFNIMSDEFMEFDIKETLRKHPDFELFGVQEVSAPLFERIKSGIAQFVKSLVGPDTPRRIVPVIIQHNSRTLSTVNFQKGDFKPAVERGYEQTNIILDRLMAT